MSTINLSGKTAIIVGGASGIGLATSKILLEDGANCIIWDKNNDQGREAVSKLQGTGRASFHYVDTTNEETILDALEIAKKDYGDPNILVNSAGILGNKGKLWEISPQHWRLVLENNLFGCFLTCHHVIPLMLKTNYGRIVNVSSVSGKDGSIYATHYTAGKAGIIALTKALAKELANANILVNCVTPSATDTPLHRAEPEEDRLRQLNKIPLGRVGQPYEVARLIEWLCSPFCSFSTGAVFDVSGGRSSY